MSSFEAIRVFVGCAANGEDAESQAVLEYTLRKFASRPVTLHWMHLGRDPKSFWYSGKGGWITHEWRTPFTGFRWAVPAYCGFLGRAIYTDSDVIWRDDVAKLWDQDIPEGKIMLSRQPGGKTYNTILWDCSAARRYLPPLSEVRSKSGAARILHWMRDHPELVGSWEGDWDCIDGGKYDSLSDTRIKLLHYSSMPNQPHLEAASRRLKAKGMRHWYDGPTGPHWRQDLIDLFNRLLEDAIAAGYSPSSYEPREPFGPYKKKSQRHRLPRTGPK